MTESAPADVDDTARPGTPERQEAHPGGLGDLVSGALSTLFGATVVVYVRGFPDLPNGYPGPALFPGIVGGLFVLFGLVLVVRWFRRRRAAPPEQPSAPSAPAADAAQPRGWVDAGCVLGSVVFYLLVVDVLGFSLTMGVLLFGLAWRLRARLLVAALSAVATTLFIYLVFERLLLVPLPTGLLG